MAAATAGFAQTIDSATIKGSVADQRGAVIAGAAIVVTNQSTGLKRDVVTDGDGNFTFSNLPLTGKYKLTVSSNGFADGVKDNIELRANEAAAFNFTLAVKGATEVGNVTIQGTTEGVQSDSAQLATRLDLRKIDETPVLGRKLTNLVQLNSSVRPARGTGDLFLNNYLFVINGNGRRQTTFSVDGSTGNDDWGRQTIFTNLPFSTIQEFTVLTNPVSAEFGRTAGNVVNVVTKSGTNDFDSDLLFLVRPSGIQTKQPLANRRTRDELLQLSGVFSGPLVEDRTHFLVGGEGNWQQRSTVVSSVLAPGTFDGKYKQGMFFARVDHRLDENNTLTGRFNLERFTDTNPSDAVGGNNLPSAARTFARNTYSAQLSETAVLSHRFVNEARAVFLLGSPITQFSPANPSTQLIRPISTEGESRSALLTNRQFQFADTLSANVGDHSVKFGGDLEYSSSGGNGQEFGTGFILGQFRFTNARSSNPAIPTSALTIADAASFTQSFGNADYTVKQWLWSAFVQDDWRLRRDLTLNLGLRYERQTFTDDTNNFAPRIGFAYNVMGDNKTIVRGSYGVYYSQLRANLGAQFNLGGPTGVFTFTATPGQLGFPTSLTALPSFPAGASLPARDIVIRPGRASYYSQFFDTSRLRGYPAALLNPTTQQGTIGVERDLGGNYFLKVDFVSAHTNKIDRLLDLNAPSVFIPFQTLATATRTATQANATRPITPVANGYRRIQVVINEGLSDYNGLQINLEKRLGRKFSFLASYTLSKTTNTVEPDAGSGDPADVNLLGENERALSQLDQRHRFVFSGSYRLPFGFTFGGVQTMAAGRPYAITAGVDTNGDGSTADRPFDTSTGTFLRRNAGKGTPTYATDLFLQKTFAYRERAKFEFRVEAFNVFNHRNIYGRSGNYGNAIIGTPSPLLGTAVGGIANTDPGREIQFLMRFRY
ncbi:MAG: TonB-dependent receptor [Acidobacteria bacterium]|nr:TonB-dependent receptor [Acidobacteriota bacterium]